MTPRHRLAVLLVFIALVGPRLQAQTEAALRQEFEGRTVTVKIAMPGTEDGIDLYPADDPPLDYPRYASRIKDNGTAIRSGETVMVTKVKVKAKLTPAITRRSPMRPSRRSRTSGNDASRAGHASTCGTAKVCRLLP